MVKINYYNEFYSNELRKIVDPPGQLYVEGNRNLLNCPGIAVIGSRCYSSYGERMCKMFVKELVKHNVVIISGLAKGIDTIAHTTCLENGGQTIAVLPCGLDNVYPIENRNLYRDIINLGGACVTEYNSKVEACSSRFLKRNRIVAGIAVGTLIVEAGYRSGTSVTARLTIEQGKKIFCIPSSLENRKGITSNELIKRGGELVTCVDDILNKFQDLKFVDTLKNKQNNNCKEEIINKEFLDIYRILTDKPLHINEIIKRSKSSINEVNYKLMMLEIEEKIIQLPGKKFIRR